MKSCGKRRRRKSRRPPELPGREHPLLHRRPAQNRHRRARQLLRRNRRRHARHRLQSQLHLRLPRKTGRRPLPGGSLLRWNLRRKRRLPAGKRLPWSRMKEPLRPRYVRQSRRARNGAFPFPQYQSESRYRIPEKFRQKRTASWKIWRATASRHFQRAGAAPAAHVPGNAGNSTGLPVP